MEIALITARQCIIMLAMMAIGFVAFRIKMLDKTSSSHISNFLMSVVVPCLIVNSLQQDYDKETLKGYFLALILAIAAHILAIIVAYVVIRNKKNESSINIARFAVIYSNAGFIAFPVYVADVAAVIFKSLTFLLLILNVFLTLPVKFPLPVIVTVAVPAFILFL